MVAKWRKESESPLKWVLEGAHGVTLQEYTTGTFPLHPYYMMYTRLSGNMEVPGKDADTAQANALEIYKRLLQAELDNL